MTLVSPLSSYATTLSGTMAANVAVEDIFRAMGADNRAFGRDTFVYDLSADTVVGRTGTITDTAVRDRLQLQTITERDDRSGYLTVRDGDFDDIVFYARSGVTDWIYLQPDRYAGFFGNVSAITTLVVVVSALLVVAGAGLSYVVSRWLYNPVAQLVEDVRERGSGEIDPGAGDMAILRQAFAGLRQQESALLGAAQRSRKKLREYALLQLLQGSDTGEDLTSAGTDFTDGSFLCAVAVIDNYRSFESKYEPERRYYVKELAFRVADELFGAGLTWYSLQFEQDKLVFLFNLSQSSHSESRNEISEDLRLVQKEIDRSLGVSLSVSVSGVHRYRAGIEQAFLEAMEGLKQRFISGPASFFNNAEAASNRMPGEMVAGETGRIVQLIRLGSEEKAESGLRSFFRGIRSRGSGYYESVQAVNFLLASTIDYLIGERIAPAEIFGDGAHPYERLAAFETLDQVEEWFVSLFNSIVAHQDQSPIAGQKYLVRFVDFIDQHFREDLSADAVAEAIGVSYSYMRRLCKEQLHTNFHDYLNTKRIDEAKRLLSATNRTMKDIATTVGYNNDQSFARFFKKYEGITPGDYRRIS
jgi:AraC-like DNA-binding protein